MRRLAFWFSSLLIGVASVVATGAPAFALRVAPPAGGPSAKLAPVVHHVAGLPSWQLALVVVAGVIVLAAATAGSALIAVSRRRRTLRPAAS